MKPHPAVIEVTALRVEREAVILESIDWRVERGEHWAILGANGSGKTSLLRALTGYLPPTSGEIRVLGETYGRFDWRDLRTRIGLVSSSVHQMMDDSETALKAVVSGRYPPPHRGARPARSSVAISFPGRAPARADRARADGFPAPHDPRRALRRTRPRRARAFSAIPQPPRPRPPRTDDGACHSSRRRNRRAVLARADTESR